MKTIKQKLRTHRWIECKHCDGYGQDDCKCKGRGGRWRKRARRRAQATQAGGQ